MSEQQSSGCSACDQLGQTPTPEHLAGVMRFDARQQAARNAESLEAENARLRERVAELEGAVTAYKAAYDAASVVWDQEDDPDGWRDRMDAAHLAVENAQGALFAALAVQEQGGAG